MEHSVIKQWKPDQMMLAESDLGTQFACIH